MGQTIKKYLCRPNIRLKETIILIAVFVFVAIPAYSLEVVYDNTVTSSGFFTSAGTGFEVGDEITLGGSNRLVTGIDLLLDASVAGTADIQIRFYENDGAGGSPGTSIWDSGLITGLSFTGTSGSADYFSFLVPNILVPDTFIWTVEFSNWTQPFYAIGIALYDPPVIGSSADFFWAKDGTWQQISYADGIVANFGAKIVAVPEPSSLLLSLVGLAVLLRKGFIRRRDL